MMLLRVFAIFLNKKVYWRVNSERATAVGLSGLPAKMTGRGY
jgi:hypothetical protein